MYFGVIIKLLMHFYNLSSVCNQRESKLLEIYSVYYIRELFLIREEALNCLLSIHTTTLRALTSIGFSRAIWGKLL